MQPRVTAILVVRRDDRGLDRALAALGSQTRRLDAVVTVDAAVDTRMTEALATAAPTRQVSARGAGLVDALAPALRALGPTESRDEWLWLLTDDSVPAPDALERLLAALEIAPSVAVAGPKLVDPDDRAMLRSFGETVSKWGATVPLVEDELDQAQYDRGPDVLAVQTAGMLVRRAVYAEVGGFDPGLPHVDAGLDFCVRVRLAGHRVIRVARAHVARAVAPEDAARRTPASSSARRRLARTAQLHRRLVWAPGWALPVLWLALLPTAVLRAVGQLLAKRPGAVFGEIGAALRAAFDGTVPGARIRLRRGRRVGWAAIAPLRMSWAELRERRAATRERQREARGVRLEIVRASFVAGGGVAVLVVLAALGTAMLWRLVGAEALTGGALRPVSDTVGLLWSNVVGQPADTILGWAPADPFTALLAILGSLTWWSPSLAIVALWFAAMPLAALGAWWCATRVSERAAPPLAAAVLWGLAPPLLFALTDGRPGALLAHVLIPWLVFAGIEAARSWSAAAGASLLFAAVVASAPSLTPALVILVLVAAAVRPRSAARLVGIPVLGLAVLAPLAVVQIARGTPFGIFADPGVAAAFAAPSGWELLLGRPAGGLDAWASAVGLVGVEGSLAALASIALPALLLVPLGVLALLAVVLPGARRAIPALVIGVVGLATAVAAAHLNVAAAGAAAATAWPGSGLSLYWFGIVAAAVVAIDALRPLSVVATSVVIALAVLGVAPAIVHQALDNAPVVSAGERTLPALVAAEAAGDPGLGTLVIRAQGDGSIAVRIERGAGTTLDATSTLDSTDVAIADDARTEEDLRLAELAGNLASFGGFDPAPALEEFGIGYVLLPPSSGDAAGTAQRITEAFDANSQLVAIGETASGALWRTEVPRSSTEAAEGLGALARGVLAGQAGILLIAVLLALPTGPRRRVVSPAVLPGEDPADTFAEDDHA
ncbi:glycosyltransferase [uncultured Schumannella sp.]|uniref:glycosyltransferase n=1 Tax=uncultured Schumannella sp. TaxID=1195956 RepID=UPI0025DB697B|nr:glycosyltransferase [uncultured Schumannella sp.]